MSEFSVSLAKLAEEANLTIAYTPCELEKIQVTATEVYRPGILLAGYYENFDSKRIQIIGLTEMSYLDELTTTLRNTHLEKLFSFQPPAVVLSRGMQPLSEMMQYGKKYGVPIDGPAYHDAEHRAGTPHHPPRCTGGGLRRGHPDPR